ncbi:MAG: hypothetical protein E6R13_08475 [Spirochaetes bacterium]|nr:MAG: hypothetical protein E6R13_08475 [Spirochaetota bacterium]
MSKEIIKQHIEKVLKNIKLDTKTESYWDNRNDESQDIVWYWNPLRHQWDFKESAVRGVIQVELRKYIDEVISENKDFVEFFL